jgi:hypothetical protein
MVSRAGLEPATTALKVRLNCPPSAPPAKNERFSYLLVALSSTQYRMVGARHGARHLTGRYNLASSVIVAARVISAGMLRAGPPT